jgi:hypothetical protein
MGPELLDRALLNPEPAPEAALPLPATVAAAAGAAGLVTAHDLLLDPAFAAAGVGGGVVAGDQGQGPGQIPWATAPVVLAAAA